MIRPVYMWCFIVFTLYTSYIWWCVGEGVRMFLGFSIKKESFFHLKPLFNPHSLTRTLGDVCGNDKKALFLSCRRAKVRVGEGLFSVVNIF